MMLCANIKDSNAEIDNITIVEQNLTNSYNINTKGFIITTTDSSHMLRYDDLIKLRVYIKYKKRIVTRKINRGYYLTAHIYYDLLGSVGTSAHIDLNPFTPVTNLSDVAEYSKFITNKISEAFNGKF